jgi:hypothetical protein
MLFFCFGDKNFDRKKFYLLRERTGNRRPATGRCDLVAYRSNYKAINTAVSKTTI